ncbi:hypothetical protein D3Z42_17640 [Lachnospiraceae bacterium]|nr:hypothetical protein [Lachnospiraceae bacterium]
MTRSGPYQGLPEETGLATVFLMETRPLPEIWEVEGESLTAWPAKEGEERAIEEAAIRMEGIEG